MTKTIVTRKEIAVPTPVIIDAAEIIWNYGLTAKLLSSDEEKTA